MNSSRNLAIKLNVLLPNERTFFSRMIPNFAFALKNHLRKQVRSDELESVEDFIAEDFDGLKYAPSYFAWAIVEKCAAAERGSRLSSGHLLLIQSELNYFADCLGACERIKNTPIPYSYSVFLKKFMFLYIMTLPFGFVF